MPNPRKEEPVYRVPLLDNKRMQDQVEAANLRATEFISLAEQLFGPMSSPWKYVGVTFRDHPPHLYYFPEACEVQIALSLRSLGDDFQRDFQLGHEVCHLLYPSVEPNNTAKPQTTVLNEGISTYFSVIVIAAYHGEDLAQAAIESLANHTPKYFFAFKQVSSLMQIDRDAIKKIRSIQPMINKVLPEDLRASGLELEDEHIDTLLTVC
jgi:hypothetical protein